MTENEAIQRLEFDRAMMIFDPTTGEEITPEILKALNKDNFFTYVADGVAIEALKEIQQYRFLGPVEECKTAMDLQKHLEEADNNLYKILLRCSEYEQIGTVEECREAVEKQKAKKCIIDSCPDHTHYKCPSCGKIHLSRYKHGFPSLGRIPRFCDHCGQAIAENLEGME